MVLDNEIVAGEVLVNKMKDFLFPLLANLHLYNQNMLYGSMELVMHISNLLLMKKLCLINWNIYVRQILPASFWCKLLKTVVNNVVLHPVNGTVNNAVEYC